MTEIEKLDDAVIEARLEELAEWTRTGDALQRTFGFGDFREAMAFVQRVAELAEDQQHHPDILVRYNKVTLTLTTHDAGGISTRDIDFASRVDTFLAEAGQPS
jgi:4a-hydroxytetrahydrobiopterin dehydratase